MKYIIWLIYILIDAIYNWYIIEKKNKVPDYLLMTIIRSMVAIIYGAFIWDLQQPEFLKWFLFVAGSFWVLFDLLINLFRSKNPFYLGTNSQIDKFGRKHPVIYWGLKVLALVGIVISFT